MSHETPNWLQSLGITESSIISGVSTITLLAALAKFTVIEAYNAWRDTIRAIRPEKAQHTHHGASKRK